MPTAYIGTDLEGDLSRAVLAKWAAIAPLGVEIPGGIGQEPLAATPATPYATLEIEPGSRADEQSTGDQEIAYRDVVFKVRTSSKADAFRLGGLVNAKFHHAALAIDGLIRFEEQKGKIEAPKDERVAGGQVWLATVRFTAWVHWDRSGHGS